MDDAARDPRPVRPERPLASDCCDGGCDRCVFDIYADELALFEQQLAAWRARQPGSVGGGGADRLVQRQPEHQRRL